MAAVYVSNLVINAGATFTQDFYLANSSTNSALNLNTSTVNSQMRKWSGSTGVTTFTSSIVDANAGHIRIGLSTSQTLNLKPGRYVYDVLVRDSSTNVTNRIIEGMVLLREAVTR